VTTVALDADVTRVPLAQRLEPGEALPARPAREVEVRGHSLAFEPRVDAGPDGHDDADELVTRHPRQVRGVVAQVAADAVQHRQPDTACFHANEHLALAGNGLAALDEVERSAPLADLCRPHASPAPSVSLSS